MPKGSRCDGPEDLERQLQESLSHLGVDYVDVYLMHNLSGTRTAVCADFQPMTPPELEAVKRAQEILAASGTVPCTGCDYCAKVRPQNIPILECFDRLEKEVLPYRKPNVLMMP